MRSQRRSISLLTLCLMTAVGCSCGTGTGAHASTRSPVPWHLAAIGAEQAWGTASGRGVVVAVLDTGIRTALLPRLQPRIVAPYDLLDGSQAVTDSDGHGTAVASVLAGGGDDGVWGVAPRVTVMPIVVANAGGQANVADVAQGVRRALDSGADIINLSMGSAHADSGIAAAVTAAAAQRVLVVAAAGDTSTPGPLFPASMTDSVIAVQAGTSDGSPTMTANGAGAGGLVAPGENITAVTIGGASSSLHAMVAGAHGSSIAAAVVTGAIAILLQCARHLGTVLDMNQALRLLRQSAAGRSFFSIPLALKAEGCN